jgi:hypothetical protein
MRSHHGSSARPRAIRPTGWFFDEVGDEVLVYDPGRHRVHCLNALAVRIWKQCDGHRTAQEIAAGVPGDAAATRDLLVETALAQLHQIGILEASGPVASGTLLTRRGLMRQLGMATAVALPLVTSIVAPAPAAAQSCRSKGQSCGRDRRCCPGLSCQKGKCKG